MPYGDGKNHICALQAGNPKLRVSLSLKPGQRNIPNLPSSQRAHSPSAYHLSGHVPTDQRERKGDQPANLGVENVPGGGKGLSRPSDVIIGF